MKYCQKGDAAMLALRRKKKNTGSTPFSDFIREAPAREKKRVYADVLEKATKDQAEVLERARQKRL